MTGIQIPNTDGEFDILAYEKLPENRKNFGENSLSSINNGIRTAEDGTELYLKVRKIDDPEPIYYENELNKTYYDKYYTELQLLYLIDYNNIPLIDYENKILEDY